MRHSLAWTLVAALVGLSGCPGDDGDATTTLTTTGPVTTSTSTTSASTTSGDTSSGGAEGSSSGNAMTEESSGGTADGGSSSSDSGMVCDPPVVGEWNSCIDDQGQIDNTLCNWMGTGQSVGTLTCLSSSADEGANVCIIRGCEDPCDCFDPPATGTAEVVCAEILEGGDMGCGLDCSAGQTCPDGMICSSGLCFWPAV